MSAIELLRQLQHHGITLTVEDGKLVSKAEKGKLTGEFINEIKANKDAIITLLKSSMSVEQTIDLPPLSVISEQEESELSYGQKRLWLLDKLQQGSSQYHMPLAFKIVGKLNPESIEIALRKLLFRHKVLRTSIKEINGKPKLALHGESQFTLQNCHISSERVSETMEFFFKQPFNLSTDLMVKACLCCITDNEFLLLINIHHIACDGWSMDIFNHELLSLYHEEFQLQKTNDEPLKIQYSDYAHWQNKLLTGAINKQLLDYWSQRLSGAPACHSLVLDHSRPAIFSPVGDKIVKALPRLLKQKVDDYCQKFSVSHNHVFKAAFGLLLHRFSGAEQLVVGSPVANRPLKEMAPMIGFFVNTLPFLFDFEKVSTPEELIEQVKKLELLDIDHQHYPFDLMVENIAQKRDLSFSPMFQIVFAMQNYQTENRVVSGVEMSLIPQENVLAKYDLSLYVYQHESQLQLQFEYATSLFEQETISSMAESYLCLLEDMLDDNQQALAHVNSISPYQKQAISHVSVGDSVAQPFASMNNALAIIVNTCEKFEQNIALSDGEQQISYLSFMSYIAAIQQQLKFANIREGDRVALVAPRTIDVFAISFAIMGMGAVYVPIDHDLPAERMHYILNDCKAKLTIAPNDILLQDMLVQYETLPMEALNIANSRNATLACVDRDNEAAYIIYTSGSTGNPKGTLISHKGLFALADGLVRKGYATSAVRVLQFANLCFDASVLEWLVAFSNGGCLYVLGNNDTKDPIFVQNFMIENHINHAFLPPSYLTYLTPERLPKLTTLGTGGEKIDLPTAQKWQKGRRYYNGYGPTETTVIVTLQEYNQLPENIYIGSPLSAVRLIVVDQNNKNVPFECPGELLISGAGVALCYLNQSALTEEKFITLADGHRYYRSGDMVKQRASGEMVYLGRNDRQVKIRGLRIELAEIETKLSNIPGVKIGCVKIFEQSSGPVITGFCEIDDAQLSNESIREQLKHVLPGYMVPSFIELLDNFPLTSNGKIDYNLLEEPRYNLSTNNEPIQGSTEESLFRIWGNLLGHTDFGATHSFFDVGGHSLLLTNLLNDIDKQWEINLPMQQVFQNPKIRQIAQLIDVLIPQPALTEDDDVEMEGGFL